MRVVEGVLKPSLLAKFPSGFPEGNGYENYVSNCVGLEGVLACAALFSPEFFDYEDMVFLSNNVENDAKNISSRNGSSKKELEEYNNLVCLSEFFLQAEDEACENEFLMLEFGRILIYYWQARLSSQFPNKDFKFILKSDLFDEDGLCITFYEK